MTNHDTAGSFIQLHLNNHIHSTWISCDLVDILEYSGHW